MSCEHLICAQCSGPVVEARCPACAQSRSQVHHHSSGLSVPVIIGALLIVLLMMMVALQLTR
ncbi:MAG TPA: hypothetical protein VG253_02575 [Streptosporangiaceae bacterium]|jgi:hypothetical protein|nr:hypothetical protein [Streptosporangiaceae bacterium]